MALAINSTQGVGVTSLWLFVFNVVHIMPQLKCHCSSLLCTHAPARSLHPFSQCMPGKLCYSGKCIVTQGRSHMYCRKALLTSKKVFFVDSNTCFNSSTGVSRSGLLEGASSLTFCLPLDTALLALACSFSGAACKAASEAASEAACFAFCAFWPICTME